MLMAFGWFVSYAFAHNWIGEAGRIALGLMAGAGFLGFGFYRMQRFVHQGAVFIVVGSTTILLTVYAARNLYHFFTPLSALAVMFLSVVVVAFASVSFRNKALAVAGLVLAGAAPLFANVTTTDHVGLFSYLMMVVLGTLWVVFVTEWRLLSLYALLVVSFHSVPHLFGFIVTTYSPQRDLLLLFAFGFTALIFLANLVSIKKNILLPLGAEVAVIMGNGLFLTVWILIAAPAEWRSLLLAAWMIVFAGASFVLARQTKRQEVFYAHGAVAVAMLVAATAAELDGPTLTLAYIAESLLIPFVVAFFTRHVESAMKSSLFVIGPMLLALESYYSPLWYRGVWHGDFAVMLLMALGLMGLGLGFRRYLSSSTSPAYAQLSTIYIMVGSGYFYLLLWKAFHAGGASMAMNGTSIFGTMICYFIYTSIGIACYFEGRKLMKNSLRLYGGALVLIVIARLILVDVWRMELGGRILTFFLVGAMLMATAFVRSQKKEINS